MLSRFSISHGGLILKSKTNFEFILGMPGNDEIRNTKDLHANKNANQAFCQGKRKNAANVAFFLQLQHTHDTFINSNGACRNLKLMPQNPN